MNRRFTLTEQIKIAAAIQLARRQAEEKLRKGEHPEWRAFYQRVLADQERVDALFASEDPEPEDAP